LPSTFNTYTSSGFGRIQVVKPLRLGDASAFALQMDSSLTFGNLYISDEVVESVDLTGISQATLSFSHVTLSDDQADNLPASFTGHANGDGVSISADGVQWFTVFNSTLSDTNWTFNSINLSTAAAAAGIVLGPNFKIKFQEYGYKGGG